MPIKDNKVNFKFGTSEEYNDTQKNNDTIYFLTDNKEIYVGDQKYSEIGPCWNSIINDDCLEILGTESFTLNMSDSKTWNGVLEYSLDHKNWTEWNGTSISSQDNRLYLRGIDNTYLVDQGQGSSFVFNTLGKIRIKGNIETLLNYKEAQRGIHSKMSNSCFRGLFKNCSSLEIPPELPAVALTNFCYYAMFDGCSSLLQTPRLPAIKLGEHCYSAMFARCTALTTVANDLLPSTIMEQACYSSMFDGCSSLINMPYLPATHLAQNCYNNMFHDCNSLVAMQPLPATSLAKQCYFHMFDSCDALTTIERLPATVLAESCYSNMFAYCTSLTNTPQDCLPATTLASHCYSDMFGHCTALTKPIELPATKLAEFCYSSMFSGCTNIKLSKTQIGDYQTPYCIPPSGNGTTASEALNGMFTNTGGTFASTPTINTTYYFASSQN